MRPADETAEALDLLLDQLQRHSSDGGARHADVDPDITQVVRDLDLLATATPIPHDLMQDLERRLARQVESLITAPSSEPAGTRQDVPRQVAAVGRITGATGEWSGAPETHLPPSPSAVEAAGGAPPYGSRPVALQSADAPRGAPRILIVDDDRDLVDLLAFALRRAGLESLLAYDGPTALRLFEQRQPGCVVLDINLGSSNGLDVLKKVRQYSQAPVIMLTAMDSEEDKVRGLEAGADDYLTKPFSHRELIARVRAQLRRSSQEQPARQATELRLEVGSIILDPSEHSVTMDGHLVSLTNTEFRLLHYLMSNAGRVVPTSELLKQVWGYQDPGGSDVVRVTIHRLRRKLEHEPMHSTLLRTIPGIGVLLRPETEPPSAPASGD